MLWAGNPSGVRDLDCSDAAHLTLAYLWEMASQPKEVHESRQKLLDNYLAAESGSDLDEVNAMRVEAGMEPLEGVPVEPAHSSMADALEMAREAGMVAPNQN